MLSPTQDSKSELIPWEYGFIKSYEDSPILWFLSWRWTGLRLTHFMIALNSSH